jgi:chromosome condensin MukBEF complex kleisin-like MukF subunit
MDATTKAYKKSLQAWMKTQRLSIKSCEMRITHAMQEIRLLQKIIDAEADELRAKKRQLEISAKDLAAIK